MLSPVGIDGSIVSRPCCGPAHGADDSEGTLDARHPTPCPGSGHARATRLYAPDVVEQLRTIDLFAGCGGMSLGFRQEGFMPVLAVEWDRAAASTYAANFGEPHTKCMDIADFPDEDIPPADVIIGGPPCQGFSALGSKDVEDPRNKLWKHYLRFVQVAQPQVFVLENVERFRRTDEFALLLAEADHGMIQGYELSHRVLLAADYGVAQRRPRTIVIGSRIGPIDHPAPTHAKVPTASMKPWETVRSRIADLPEVPEHFDLPKSKSTFFGKDIAGVFKGQDLHFGRRPVPRSLDRYNVIQPGQGRLDLPSHLLSPCGARKPKGTTDVMGRMVWDQPSLTIRTEFFKPEKGRYLHPQWEPDESRRVNRVITHLEASLLQDFPSDYEWCGSKVEIARQIGNAVPSGLARAIARSLKSRLR